MRDCSPTVNDRHAPASGASWLAQACGIATRELSLRRVVAETATIQKYEADVALRPWAYSSHPQRPKINMHHHRVERASNAHTVESNPELF